MTRTITIGSRYLKEGIKRDYNNWRRAWARECAQNSIDAGSSNVYIGVALDDNGDTVVNWTDNGCGMTEDIVVNKLMALGETTKTNGTGGFGVAFALIGLAQKSYTIRTNGILVKGAGSHYDINKCEFSKGTSLTVIMEGNEEDRIICAIRRWVKLSSSSVKFYLNGEQLDSFRRGRPKAETPWCKIFTANNTDYADKVYVRMNGQLMFDVYSRVDGVNVIVDLCGESLQYLTSNRDGLNYIWSSKLQSLIQEIFEDPKKIKQANDHTTVWRGKKGLVRFEEGKKPTRMSLSQKPIVGAAAKVLAKKISSGDIVPSNQVVPIYEAKTEREIKTLIDGYDVVVLNQTNQPVPEKFIPGLMSKHAYAVLNRWIRVVQAAGNILGRSEEVCVGFVFSDTARAVHKYTSEFGHMILVNPVEINSKGNRFVNYWNNSTASFSKMVGVAVHELSHIDNSSHDAAFAATLTYDIPKVMSRTTILSKIKKETKV